MSGASVGVDVSLEQQANEILAGELLARQVGQKRGILSARQQRRRKARELCLPFMDTTHERVVDWYTEGRVRFERSKEDFIRQVKEGAG